jgi:uncharacterized protein (TIGR02246 family)
MRHGDPGGDRVPRLLGDLKLDRALGFLLRDDRAGRDPAALDDIVDAESYAQDGRIVINRGEPWEGRTGIAEMAAGFFADVPDLTLVCDEVRCAGDHVVYLWAFTGTHSGTKNPLRVVGWEEWDLDADLKVTASRGWFDADDYARQTAAE